MQTTDFLTHLLSHMKSCNSLVESFSSNWVGKKRDFTILGSSSAGPVQFEETTHELHDYSSLSHYPEYPGPTTEKHYVDYTGPGYSG